MEEGEGEREGGTVKDQPTCSSNQYYAIHSGTGLYNGTNTAALPSGIMPVYAEEIHTQEHH